MAFYTVSQEVYSLADHLRRIINTIDTVPAENFEEDEEANIDDAITTLTSTFAAFGDVINSYDFSVPYWQSSLYDSVKEFEDLVYRCNYSDRLSVRNTIFAVEANL